MTFRLSVKMVRSSQRQGCSSQHFCTTTWSSSWDKYFEYSINAINSPKDSPDNEFDFQETEDRFMSILLPDCSSHDLKKLLLMGASEDENSLIEKDKFSTSYFFCDKYKIGSEWKESSLEW